MIKTITSYVYHSFFLCANYFNRLENVLDDAEKAYDTKVKQVDINIYIIPSNFFYILGS